MADSDICAVWAVDESKTYRCTGIINESNPIPTGSYPSMSGSGVSYSDTLASGGTTVTMIASNMANVSRVGFTLFHIEVNVPAGATIKVTYRFNHTATKTVSSGSDTTRWISGINELGDDKTVLDSCGFTASGSPVVGVKKTYLTETNACSQNAAGDFEVIFTNNESSPKDCTNYFILYTLVRSGSSSPSVGFNTSVTVSDTKVTEEFINAPANLTTTYDGNNHWINSFSDAWIKDDHTNANAVVVKNVSYAPYEGSVQDLGTDTSNIVDAGVYTVKMGLAAGFNKRWSDETISDKIFTITVAKANPNVTPKFTAAPLPNPLYVSYNDGKLPELTNNAQNATPGTIEWQSDQSPTEGTTVYYWQFTPTNTNNYNKITNKSDATKMTVPYVTQGIDHLELTLRMDGDGDDAQPVKIYDAYSLADLKKYIKVEAVYDDGVTKVALGDADYDFKRVDNQNKLTVGNVAVRAVKKTTNETGNLTINVLEAKVEEISVDYNDNGTHLVYSDALTVEDVKNNLTVTARWNYSGTKFLNVAIADVTVTGDIEAGEDLEFTAAYGGKSGAFYVTIDKGTLDISGITFTGGSPVTYNGQPHSIAYEGTLPDGVGVQYTYGTKTQSTPFEFTEADEYEITLSFTQDDTDNYEVITKTIKATLKIIDAVITDITVDFGQGDTAVYPSTDLDTLKDLITVTAAYNNGTSEVITDYDLSGTLTAGASTITVEYGGFTKTITVTVTAIALDRIEAEFTQGGAVYPSTGLDTLKDWLTVTAYYNDESEEVVTDYELSGTLTAGDCEIIVTYGGKEFAITVEVTAIQLVRIEVEFEQDGEVYPTSSLGVLKPWLTVTAYYNDQSEEVVSDYELSGEFTIENCEITVTYGGLEKTVSVEVTDVAIVDVDFTFMQDGVVYPSSNLEVLRQWLTVTATFNNEATDEIANYELSGEFTVGGSQITVTYGDFTETITVTVTAIAVDYIEAEFAQGGVVYYTTRLSVLKDWLTVTAHYTDGTSGVVTDYELSGALTVGASQITVTYGAEHTDTFTVTVDKVKVALPTFKGGLKYTGVTVKPTVNDFNGYDSALMTFVTDKLQSGLYVGTYKAVFALNDPENYEWATATANSKKVFAAVVFDGETEVILNANEAAVDWNIAKAVLTATKTDGGLPVFASESYIGAFSDVVTLKYYKDEACTEEVAAEDLKYETQYFVKAELLDTENFELDTSAAQYTVKSFTYTTPAKELTLWDKIVKFIVTNWLWLVIAVVALILFITVIALIARAAKRKREREEQRRLEEKEEKKREQEERRLEREERMARLSQQQQMPQMMMPQMMPQMAGGQMPVQQSMPQAAQPMTMGGGASSSELAELRAELKAEFLAIKVDQNSKDIAANEIAQLRNEVSAMHNEMTYAKRTDQISGMPVDALTEALTIALKNVLGGQTLDAPKAEQAKKEEVVPAAAQVPPDAIMTTVTTTKIDTTKKPAQSAQAAPVRTVVRNLVAPMPVDDGRVFDVGGFYKPADPMTDMEPIDDEKGE